MKKVYPDAKAALAGLLRDDMTIMAGGFGLCGIPESPDRRHPRCRRQGPDRHLQQRRHRRLRPRPAARDAAGQEDDLVLRRREQDLRQAVPRAASSRSSSTRRARSPSASAPAAPASRPSTPGPASAPWSPRARKSREFDGEHVRPRARPRRRPVRREGLEGRHRGQPRLPQDRAQLQPDDGDRRARSPSPRSRSSSSRASSTPTTSHTPGIFVQAHHPRAAAYEKRIEQRTVRKRQAA